VKLDEKRYPITHRYNSGETFKEIGLSLNNSSRQWANALFQKELNEIIKKEKAFTEIIKELISKESLYYDLTSLAYGKIIAVILKQRYAYSSIFNDTFVTKEKLSIKAIQKEVISLVKEKNNYYPLSLELESAIGFDDIVCFALKEFEVLRWNSKKRVQERVLLSSSFRQYRSKKSNMVFLEHKGRKATILKDIIYL